jgi:hypothetical protein
MADNTMPQRKEKKEKKGQILVDIALRRSHDILFNSKTSLQKVCKHLLATIDYSERDINRMTTLQY